MNIDIIILAAGQGSRMRSALPKVLHRIGGKFMLQHVIDHANELENSSNIMTTHVVVGHQAQLVEASLAGQNIIFAQQDEQLGTGHAVAQAVNNISSDGISLILYGDVPLTQTATMQELIDIGKNEQLGLLTVDLADPSGYGRIIRNVGGQVTAIVEQKDASPAQLNVGEINTGIMAVPNKFLRKWIAQLGNDNAQGEYYLTDIIAMAAADKVAIVTRSPVAEQEVQGVNDKVQLALLERFYQLQRANALMLAGATLTDPNRIDIRGSVTIKGEVLIEANVLFEGAVVLGAGVQIAANCIIKDAVIGADSIIKANSMIEQSVVGSACEVGPFARLRPGTELADKAKVGNFVETKKAIIGEGSKVSHLTYLGDARIGSGVNVGAGTITCNYDGVNKFTTEIGDGAFIGSNASLVAPLKIGAGATVGAGSTITKDVPAQQLTVARAKQVHLKNWQRPVKK
ncbi:MAG: bifunctional UDP-N-acetylglucosamine diphosphorylase/glucosamine-1-phosphate N-acetyltransferase GlmU [Pseudomonadales bacterium]|nr:bifunctional UDP-N-acetylglucosamine diphosphorylase/glucosamine-1-phosphate N-acetyltransferase GlmU [Pseudomonadales bacterium]NRA15825.1 bifunctional UDP-N-acetylglucosamine diphosphorylase/glucosamine-1-phosphate N-acetyltransferase GlmU [Oceanospirillaceae bacterium]